jgi:hypothetical protein
MALPVTVGNLSTAIAPVGPFRSSSGNFYIFGRDATTATTLQAIKATDPTSSFSSVSTKTGFTTAILEVGAYQVADVIHFVVTDGTLASSLNRKYQTFDMSSDTFVTAETIVSALSTGGSVDSALADIVVRTNGEVLVAGNSGTTVTGSARARTSYWRRTAPATWSTTSIDGATQAFDHFYMTMCILANRVHFFVRPANGASDALYCRTLSAANVLSAFSQVQSYGANRSGHTVKALAWNDGSADRCFVQFGWDDGFLYGGYVNSTDSLGTLTEVGVAGGSTGGTMDWPYMGYVGPSATTAFDTYVAVSRNISGSDLYKTVAINTSATGFVAPVLMETATVTAADYALAQDAPVSWRGGNYIIPYLYLDTGVWRYNESVLRGGAPADGPAWSFVGVSSPVNITAATAHTLTVPAGAIEGDLLVAVISSRIASTTSITLPAGWTRVTEQKTNNVLTTTSAVASGMMAYIVRGASAPALTFTHPVNVDQAMGQIVAYRGNDPTPLDTQNSATTAINTTSVSVAGVTTTKDKDLLVVGLCGGQEAAWSVIDAVTDPSTASGATNTTTAPTAGTWIERADSTFTTGSDGSLAIADAVKATAGATGNITATASLGASHAILIGAFEFLQAAAGSVGAATGTGTATGAGVAQSRGSAAGTGTATAAVQRIGAGAAAGTSTAQASGQAIIPTTAAASGTGASSVVGTFVALVSGQGQAAGTGSATAAAIAQSRGAAAGAGAANAAGTGITTAQGAATGAGAASAAAIVFPTIVGNLSTAIPPVGPFQSSTGNIYVLGRDSATATTLRAMKASDPPTSFGSAGTKTGFTTAILDVAASQVGDVIHLVVTDGTLASSLNRKYQTFNMASDTFVTAETIVSAINTGGDGQTIYADIAVRSNGEVMVAGNSARTLTSGTNYARTSYYRRTGVATWSPGSIDGAATAYDHIFLCMCEVGDRLHFFVKPYGAPAGSINGYTYVRTLSAANALSSLNQIASYAAFTQNSECVTWNDGIADRLHVNYGYGDGNVYGLYGNSSDNLSAMSGSGVGGSGVAQAPYNAYVDGSSVVSIWNRTDTSDLTFAASTVSDASSFGAAQLLWAGTVTQATEAMAQDGLVYVRAGQVVVPFVYLESGVWNYAEYARRSFGAYGTAGGFGTAQATGTARIAAVAAASGSGASAVTGSTVVGATASASGVGSSAVVGATAAVIVSATAAATGSGAASASGTGIASAVGAASGTGASAVVGARTVAAVAAAAGVGSTAVVGSSTALASGSAAGTSTAQASATITGTGTGNAAGTSTAQATATATVTASGSAAGTGTAQALSVSKGVAAGQGGAQATGTAISPSLAAASGTGAAVVVGAGFKIAVGNSAGSSTAQAIASSVGSAVAQGTASAPGVSARAAIGGASGVGASSVAGTQIAAAVAAATGTSSATAISFAGSAIAAAAGGSTAQAVGGAINTATASAAGTSSAAAIGQVTSSATAAATGSSTAQATGNKTASVTAAAAGVGASSVVGSLTATAIGSAAGSSTAQALASGAASSTGAAIGTGAASAAGRWALSGVAQASGTGASAVVGAIGMVQAVAAATATGSASAVGTEIRGATAAAAGSGASVVVGRATAASVATASASGTAQATASVSSGAFGTATGSGTAQATGTWTVAAVASAAGTSTATGSGAVGILQGAAAAAGTGAASAVGAKIAGSLAASAGISTAQATGVVARVGTGAAVGSGTAQATARPTVGGTAAALGTGTANAVSRVTAAAVASAQGIGQGVLIGNALQAAVAQAAGVGLSNVKTIAIQPSPIDADRIAYVDEDVRAAAVAPVESAAAVDEQNRLTEVSPAEAAVQAEPQDRIAVTSEQQRAA